MTRKRKQKSNVVTLVNGLQECHIKEEKTPPSTGKTILDLNVNAELLAKWPKLKLKVPPLFLHKPINFGLHVKKVLNMGIQFYHPNLGQNYTKITCASLKDHKYLIKYFEKKQLPFHTFANPSKRKMKVVIRGIPKDTDLEKIKEALKSVSVPILRVHKMHTKEERRDNTMLVLAVVPYDNEGIKILKLTQLLGHTVKLEPPVIKPRQCYRCQKWGHSQRYCHGVFRCVKCGGDHSYKKCERIPGNEPPKCANCGGEHTANYKQCAVVPEDDIKILIGWKPQRRLFKPLEIVTLENYELLYKNVDYDSMSSTSV